MCDRGTTAAESGDDEVFDPGSLTKAQVMGDACAVCHTRWPRPRDPLGELPDGTEVYGCAECAEIAADHRRASMFDHMFAAH
nr:hypothetical protein [Actinorugispora endophytica]